CRGALARNLRVGSRREGRLVRSTAFRRWSADHRLKAVLRTNRPPRSEQSLEGQVSAGAARGRSPIGRGKALLTRAERVSIVRPLSVTSTLPLPRGLIRPRAARGAITNEVGPMNHRV